MRNKFFPFIAIFLAITLTINLISVPSYVNPDPIAEFAFRIVKPGTYLPILSSSYTIYPIDKTGSSVVTLFGPEDATLTIQSYLSGARPNAIYAWVRSGPGILIGKAGVKVRGAARIYPSTIIVIVLP